MMHRRWVSRDHDSAAAERIRAALGIPAITARLLTQRGVSDPDAAAAFLEPSLDQLLDPFRLLGMRAAVERIGKAIEAKEKILIYGDYDVDGTTATVLLLKTFEMLGGDASFHVPHRVREGYGMREDVIERAASEGVKLLISVDTGIREAAVVERARELGIDAIITDHHLPEEAAPRALAVINPNQPGCDYPDKNLCGVGIAFKLAQALLSETDWPREKVAKILTSMLKIVAIGTVADLVPLAGENRVFVKIGLEGLRTPRNPGLEALLEVAGLLEKGVVSAGDVGFRIGPRINAAGRMDTARDVVELFTTANPERARELAQKLDGLNAERQAAEEAVVEEILERLGRVPPPDVLPFLVVEGEGWHPGVIGICASRIVERFHRPTLVLSIDPATGLATGSGRSIPAFHLVEALEAMAPIFERFGGHKMAAGCSLKAERIEALREGLNEHALNLLGPDDFIPELMVDDELEFAAIGDELMGSIAKLAPHGLGNPTPVFATAGVRLLAEPRVLKEKHLKLRLDHGGSNLWAMGWRMAQLHPSLPAGAAMDAAYAVEADDYWGGWRLNLKDLREPER
ncbi:MAG: single-stranded-DNA-specific exonuclease RecJ [Bryobacterales bacterium]|nr:single-stranded-DNA-specific exonuclease RecJ [Bryobacterales bacterium]